MLRLPSTALLVALLCATAASAQGNRLRYVVDDSQSEVEAIVPFLGVSSKTARFPDMSGNLTLDISDFEAIDMAVTVDARTLTTGDSQTARLRGRQFFDVANHPTVRFTGTHIRFANDRTATVTGQVTARGVTRPSTIALTFSRPPLSGDPNLPITAVGTTTIDRRQFGMTAFPLVIGNRVAVTIRARMVPG